MKFPFTLLRSAFALAILMSAAPAKAQDGDVRLPVEFDGLIEFRAVESDLDFDQGQDIDTAGIGARARVGATIPVGEKTAIRAEIEGRHFTFRDENRDDLQTGIARLRVTHQLSDKVEVRLQAARHENIVVLEASKADQTSLGARLQVEDGNDRFRLTGEYRERQYDTTVGGDSNGYRVAAQYNRRLGSYHWVRFDIRHEEMTSPNEPFRSYQRQVARIKYSRPLNRKLRVRPSLEYRQWSYDNRIAQGGGGALREDSYVAPGVDLSWGSAVRGPYAVANVEYRFRDSNDTRFDNDAIRVGVRLGYRF